MLARRHGKESSMDTQISWTVKPLPILPEVHLDMSSEGWANDQASQKGRKPSEVMPRAEVNEDYRRLFEAAVKGDWRDAEKNLIHYPNAMEATVMTIEGKPITLLEVAAKAAQDKFVENLVKRLPLVFKNDIITAALHDAARGGRIRMVKALVDRVDAKDESLDSALVYAISWAPLEKEVIRYLARRITSAPSYGSMSSLIMAGHMDIVLNLAKQFTELATCKDTNDNSLLGDLAKTKSCFCSGARLNFWENFIYKCIPLCLIDTSFDNPKDTEIARGTSINLLNRMTNTEKSISSREPIDTKDEQQGLHQFIKMARVSPALMRFKISLWNLATKPAPVIKRIGESKLRHKCSFKLADLALTKMKTTTKIPETLGFLLTSRIVLHAASRGISEIVKLCFKHYPELMWEENFTKELIKEVVKGRNVELLKLVKTHNIIPCLTYDMWTKDGLEEALVKWSPRRVPADVSGAAFLMQRELRWFKVLEDMSDPSFKSEESQEEKTCWEVRWEDFVEERKDLLKKAGLWMKDTSSSCSVVATLITTVAFAAAFTVPGGNDSSTGIPIILRNGSFMVFAIADAIALFSSVTATLMFLAILTSRYEIEDFLHSLPKKILLGLTFLFLSLAFMLVAFGSALTIVLSKRLNWIYIPITLLASFPVVSFTILQLPLCIEMAKSTYWACL